MLCHCKDVVSVIHQVVQSRAPWMEIHFDRTPFKVELLQSSVHAESLLQGFVHVKTDNDPFQLTDFATAEGSSLPPLASKSRYFTALHVSS